jgi:hypothetical protein
MSIIKKDLKMIRVKNKSFEQWLYEDVERAFDLTRLRQHARLDSLKALSFRPEIFEKKLEMIETLRQDLLDNVDSWNEDELKFMFISPIIAIIEYKSPNYKIFTQRPMSVKYENDTKTTSGKVEFMIATGKQTPRKPFFFLHEYKQENRRDNDPLGQLLIAMVAAQLQNADEKPLFGCYVSGRNWFFIILDGKEYAISNAFNSADTTMLNQILAILIYFKEQANVYFMPTKKG